MSRIGVLLKQQVARKPMPPALNRKQILSYLQTFFQQAYILWNCLC
jgi:hypothetical protein